MEGKGFFRAERAAPDLFPEFHRNQLVGLDERLRLFRLQEFEVSENQLVIGALAVGMDEGALELVAPVRDGGFLRRDAANLQRLDLIVNLSLIHI